MPSERHKNHDSESLAKTKRDFLLETENGSCVHVHTISPSNQSRSATVILSHGFNTAGTEGAQRFLKLAHMLADDGYRCILFDYRGWGYSDLSTDEMTFDTELRDLEAVIDYAHVTHPMDDLTLLGNSLGAAVVAHTAARRQDIALIVLWCLSANLHARYRTRLHPDIESTGFVYYNAYKIGKGFLRSLEDRETFEAIRQADIPALLVHGDADLTAPVELSREAHRLAKKTTTLVEIADASHSFSTPPTAIDEAIAVTLAWLNRHKHTR